MKFNYTAHKGLWNWLADNPSAEKIEWPGWLRNGGSFEDMLFHCPACQYARWNTGGCFKCPLIWVGEDGNDASKFYIACDHSYYGDWKRVGPSKKSELARQIANLPVREGVECE